tara:strand:+ start:834 stop:980 length:147 start_codon:yes stop_codon:yes gene_type:complete
MLLLSETATVPGSLPSPPAIVLSAGSGEFSPCHQTPAITVTMIPSIPS